VYYRHLRQESGASMQLSSVRIGRVVAVLWMSSLLSGCGLIYRQTIEQGNQVEQVMVDQLKPGMSKRQVTLIMGSPAIQSSFHQQRWDYVSSVKDGRSGSLENKKLTLFFQGDQLARIEGDYKPGAGKTEESAAETDAADASEG
jgi:outer membrane protein assembly factor BamE